MRLKLAEEKHSLTAIWNGLEKRSRFTFLSSLLIASLTHLVHFVVMWVNEDNMGLPWISTQAVRVSSGRWSNLLYCFPRRVLPVIFGALMLLFLCLSVVYTVKLFDIRNEWLILAAAGVLTTFPVLAYINGYVPDTFIYPFALLMAVLAVYATEKYHRWGWAAGAVLLGFSMGWYQAFVAQVICLCLLMLIRKVVSGHVSPKEFWKNSVLRYCFMGAGGAVFYFLMVKVSLLLLNRDLSSYKGIDSMGRIPLEKLPELLTRPYDRVFALLTGKGFWEVKPYALAATLVLAVLSLFLLMVLIWKNHIRPAVVLLLAVLLFLLPLGSDVIDVVSVETGASTLNVYSVVLLYLLPVLLLEASFGIEDPGKGFGERLKEWNCRLVVLGLLLVGMNQMSISATFYQLESRYYEFTAALLNRVLARVEQEEAFERLGEVPHVAVVVNRDTPPYRFLGTGESYPEFDEIDGIRGKFLGFNNQNQGQSKTSSYKMVVFISNLTGVQLDAVEAQKEKKIMQSQEYLDMKVWPAKESVKEINGVIVVNFAVPCRIEAKTEGETIRFTPQFGEELLRFQNFEWKIYRDGECIEKRKAETPEPIVISAESGTYRARLVCRGEITHGELGTLAGYNAVIDTSGTELKFFYDSEEVILPAVPN